MKLRRHKEEHEEMTIEHIINLLILQMLDSDTTTHIVKARGPYQRRGELDTIYRQAWQAI